MRQQHPTLISLLDRLYGLPRSQARLLPFLVSCATVNCEQLEGGAMKGVRLSQLCHRRVAMYDSVFANPRRAPGSRCFPASWHSLCYAAVLQTLEFCKSRERSASREAALQWQILFPIHPEDVSVKPSCEPCGSCQSCGLWGRLGQRFHETEPAETLRNGHAVLYFEGSPSSDRLRRSVAPAFVQPPAQHLDRCRKAAGE